MSENVVHSYPLYFVFLCIAWVPNYMSAAIAAASRMKNFERFNDDRSSGPAMNKDKQDAADAYLEMMQQHNSSSCSSDRENRPLVK